MLLFVSLQQQTPLLQPRPVRALKNDARFHPNSLQLGESLGPPGEPGVPRSMPLEQGEATQAAMHGLGISLGVAQPDGMLGSRTGSGSRLSWKRPNSCHDEPAPGGNMTPGAEAPCNSFER